MKALTRSLLHRMSHSRSFLRQHQHAATLVVASASPRYFSGNGNNDDTDPHALFRQQMEQLKEEREEMFGFTEDDHNAWSNAGDPTDQLPASLMRSVDRARKAQAANQNDPVFLSNDDLQTSHHMDLGDHRFSNEDTPIAINEDLNVENYEPAHGLTHLSEDGSSVNMVDVGHKSWTRRMARAETKMILPPEVLKAFQHTSQHEIVGPKGPIFATAKVAGIIAAKRTSDLIPLCHPLPLEKVQIDVRLENDVVFISCECRVTHKTGVEMEALTGASVTALTIYDMLKALSHNIRIEETKLVAKSGGKRTVG